MVLFDVDLLVEILMEFEWFGIVFLVINVVFIFCKVKVKGVVMEIVLCGVEDLLWV